MNLLDTLIETERLRIIPISMDYAQDIFREFTWEITTYMFPKPPDRIEETQQFIYASLQSLQDGKHLQVVVLEKDTEHFLGLAGLHKVHTPTPELGIWMKKSAHGHGYGQETISALIQWAKQNLQYHYLIYPVDERNIPSKKIPESYNGQIARKYRIESQSKRELSILEYRIFPD